MEEDQNSNNEKVSSKTGLEEDSKIDLSAHVSNADAAVKKLPSHKRMSSLKVIRKRRSLEEMSDTGSSDQSFLISTPTEDEIKPLNFRHGSKTKSRNPHLKLIQIIRLPEKGKHRIHLSTTVVKMSSESDDDELLFKGWVGRVTVSGRRGTGGRRKNFFLRVLSWIQKEIMACSCISCPLRSIPGARSTKVRPVDINQRHGSSYYKTGRQEVKRKFTTENVNLGLQRTPSFLLSRLLPIRERLERI